MIGPFAGKHFWKDFDWPLLTSALLLSVLSLTEIYSSTMAQPSENFFLRQLAWVVVGIVFLFVVAAIDYRLISEHIPWLYVLAVGSLLYTLALGHRVAGSKSWVVLGRIQFQPSEVIKMVVVFVGVVGNVALAVVIDGASVGAMAGAKVAMTGGKVALKIGKKMVTKNIAKSTTRKIMKSKTKQINKKLGKKTLDHATDTLVQLKKQNQLN